MNLLAIDWWSHEFISVDWIVLIVGMLAVTGLVWRSVVQDKKAQQGEDSSAYLFGKGEPWYVIGMAIFAANIGSEHLVGLAGTGAKSGVGMAHWEMQGWMILILGWLFVPFYQLLITKMGKIITMPDFLKFRYTKATGSWLSIITLVAYVLTKVSVTALTGGVFFKYLWGLNFWVGAISLIVITCIFTVLGGMKGVMTLSTVQTPILIIGSFVVLFLGLATLGAGEGIVAGWNNMMDFCNQLNNGYGTTHMFHWEAGDGMYQEYPGFVVFLGAAIIGFWYWCTDQHIVQRVLGQTPGESNEEVIKRARRGTIAAGFFKVLPCFMFLIPGMICAALAARGDIPLEDTDSAYAILVKTVLPAGAKGVITIGFVCALVASLAAFFNSCATLFTEDFYKPMKQGMSEAHYVLVGRIATVIVVLLGFAWLPIMMSLGSLYDYLQGIQSLLAPTMVAVFALGIFSKKVTPKAGEWTMIVGFTIGMVRLLTNVLTDTGKALYSIPEGFVRGTLNGQGLLENSEGIFTFTATNTDTGATATVFEGMTGFWENTAWFWQTNWLVFECWLLVFLLVFMVVVSCFTPAPTKEQVDAITFTGSFKEEISKSMGWFDYVGSGIVIALCAAFYWYFW